MAKFRSVPRPRSEEDFVKSAEPTMALIEKEGEGDVVAPVPPVATATPMITTKPAARRKKAKPTASRPWEDLDPNERADISQTVRLNAYQHEQLRWIAAQEDRSLSQVLRRLIGPALDSAT